MISLEKWLILTPLQKLSKTVGDLSKLIDAKGFKKSPKVQKIAKSGHTARYQLKAVMLIVLLEQRELDLKEFALKVKSDEHNCLRVENEAIRQKNSSLESEKEALQAEKALLVHQCEALNGEAGNLREELRIATREKEALVFEKEEQVGNLLTENTYLANDKEQVPSLFMGMIIQWLGKK